MHYIWSKGYYKRHREMEWSHWFIITNYMGWIWRKTWFSKQYWQKREVARLEAKLMKKYD